VILRALEIAGAHLIELEPRSDERGFLARSFCRHEFAAAGLAFEVVQGNLSGNVRRGTLRGLHWQAAPQAEAKIVRCSAGAVFDVLVDIRPGSPSWGRWLAVELSAANRLSLHIPPGVAHGFQTLADQTELAYLMSAAYEPVLARGLRWDDPQLAIPWPLPEPILSERDRRWPGLADLPC
jgi:dTDP-4-dehydrorhamnose 3,5-epimerase